jgi:hypothetical protein
VRVVEVEDEGRGADGVSGSRHGHDPDVSEVHDLVVGVVGGTFPQERLIGRERRWDVPGVPESVVPDALDVFARGVQRYLAAGVLDHGDEFPRGPVVVEVGVGVQHVGDLAGVEAHPFDVLPVLVSAVGPAGVDEDQPVVRRFRGAHVRVEQVEGHLVVADVEQGVFHDLERLGAAGVGRLADAGGQDVDVRAPGHRVDTLVAEQGALCGDVPDGEAVRGVVWCEVVDGPNVRRVGLPVVAVEDDECGLPLGGGVVVVFRHRDPVE